MPIIPATWEAEIGRLVFRTTLGSNFSEIPPSKSINQKWHMPVIPSLRGIMGKKVMV
jgi:hypothetical protein